MSHDNPAGDRTFFRFDRNAFNPIAGTKFAVGVVVAIGLTTFTDLDLLVVLVSGLLAWLTDLPGTLRYRALGMATFGVFGVGMIALGGLIFLPRAAIATLGLLIVCGHNAFDGVAAADRLT